MRLNAFGEAISALLCLWILVDTVEVASAQPLRARGRYVVDMTGDRVKLMCVNWYGAHLKTFVQNGLSKRNAHEIAQKISSMGFNCVRLSYSTEAYVRNPVVRPSYIAALANTTGRTFLDLFDEVVAALTDEKLMVIINNHNSGAGWCCALDDGSSLWFSQDYPEKLWIESLVGLAKRYRDNRLVVGYDLRNEPRIDFKMMAMPTWGDPTVIPPLFNRSWIPRLFDPPSGLQDWRTAVERAGTAVLAQDPDALIVVEVLYAVGECAHRLRNYPLRGLDGHVVWSAHDYSWHTTIASFSWETCTKEIDAYHFGALFRATWTLMGTFDTGWIAGAFHLTWFSLLAALAIKMLAGSLRCRYGIAISFISVFLAGGILLILACAASIFGACASGALWCGDFDMWKTDTYEAFVASRDANYGHIANSGLGPMWVAEFGTDEPHKFWNWTIAYLRERDFDFAYWSVDGDHFPIEANQFGEGIRGMGNETYGILNSDYQAVRHAWKLEDLQSLMHVAQSPHSDKLFSSVQDEKKRRNEL